MVRILDLFCGAGGASLGYVRAGWEVVGVDLNPMPRYPMPFKQGDALAVLRQLLDGESVSFSGHVLGLHHFDAIHASPPCQSYSVTRHSHSIEYPRLIEPLRELLIETTLPYVIENVVGAPLHDPLTLCGTMFGLTAKDTRDGTLLELRRHRLFESNVELPPLECKHEHAVGGVYGGGSSRRSSTRDWEKGRPGRGGYTPVKAVRENLMGIYTMTSRELSEAIPPAYTEYVGRQLAEAIA